ncbi:YXWGXW repeat-containing protein [Cupriavidus sp. D39]|uniref:YXWGXW repeat-containing protein n=1 Tax=Cupriavidus sp. D39 TaxID=2997877 RepID=UPI0022709490|nr:YXWGXW repeat-containing protein [Cupriavidus sp. D39]MCY0858330.1 YXWGXW repeat-containing protein [Cupriavidus sp. D39]
MRRSIALSSSLACLGVAMTAAFALAPAFAQTIVIAPSAPPPMRQEVLPPARGGYVWDPGHWQWRNGAYVWLRGHWRPARAGYRWVSGHWVARGPQWRWVEGHWAP